MTFRYNSRSSHSSRHRKTGEDKRRMDLQDERFARQEERQNHQFEAIEQLRLWMEQRLDTLLDAHPALETISRRRNRERVDGRPDGRASTGASTLKAEQNEAESENSLLDAPLDARPAGRPLEDLNTPKGIFSPILLLSPPSVPRYDIVHPCV
nr:hypothetical protein Iba_chr15dCG7250 [Ipomoea batatas]